MRKETRIMKILPTNLVHNMSLNRSTAAKKNPQDENRKGIACDSNDYCSWVVGGRVLLPGGALLLALEVQS